jgi:hypothetical protein
MRLKLKYLRLRAQWAKLLILRPKLVLIVLRAWYESDGKLYITHIYRTKKQQRAFYPNDPDKVSVHQLWRGVDMGIRGISDVRLVGIIELINKEYPYGKGKFKTAIVHSIGRGRHLHLQVRG